MPTFTSHKPGTFSWIELATTDADAAKRFYGGVFGWKFEDMPSGPDMVYTFASVAGGPVGALYKMGKDMKGVPTHWASYITVENADDSAKKITAAGGKLVKAPFDVMDVGRMAVVEDPAGAVFCIWEAKKHHGASVKLESGALCWNECLTTNIDKAAKFYATVFGWKPTPVEMGAGPAYTLMKLAGTDENAGGMMATPPDMRGVPSHWLAYIGTGDVDASAKKVTELGGKILVPPMDIPNVGRFAVAQDPIGAGFALFHGKT
jgi:predicted enzyme related to lactoylglutathione lyase